MKPTGIRVAYPSQALLKTLLTGHAPAGPRQGDARPDR